MNRRRLGQHWLVWEWGCLRAPGFAAEDILRLASPDVARAADAVIRDAELVEQARTRAIDVLVRAPASKLVNKTIKALRRGELPATLDALEPALQTELQPVVRATEQLARTRATAETLLEDEATRVANALHGTARSPQFREALLWQNRGAVHGSIDALLRRPADARDSKTREQQRLVAMCLQRYCVKNDTIGFFGPVGWLRLRDDPEPIVVRPGTSLLASRSVYFEYWAIDALARTLARDPELRPAMKPRRAPRVFLDGNVLWHPNGKQIELPDVFARVLAAIDGERTARQVASAVLADGGGLDSEPEVYELLDQLAAKGLCSWALELPTATFHPEHELRALIAGADEAPRTRALAALDQLEARRDAVARAAGDPDALDHALHELESAFETLTGEAASRKGGETYAGRTLVFEDCRRDLEVDLGTAFVERLGPPMALVLDSARWYTHAIATRYHAAFGALYRELRASGEVTLLRFQQHMTPLFPGPRHDAGIAYEVARELETRWETILRVGDGATKQIVRAVDELRAAVADAFDAPAPGWPSARHHSPDILIAADGIDAIKRGRYQIVLGELHVGFNTVTLPCLLKEHPEPAILVRAREEDLPAPGIAPVWSKARNRADLFSVSRHDFELETGETRSGRTRDHVLQTGELVIEERDDVLVARTRDGARRFSLVALLEQHLIAESFSRFRIVGRRPHVPRVVLGDLIIQRETWHVDAATLGFAQERTELDRFAGARRHAERHDMPRMIYVKTDAEAKPFFVDLESPILVEILAKQVKRAQRVSFSEMAPDLNACWLTDREGRRYTSELRLAVTDERGA
ncbi:MAG TPA: lantibiotic dehydratase [Kofleriaceae bacterium]|nr:lantibiotic dehydratase [Kofleriaceae bacterium]